MAGGDGEAWLAEGLREVGLASVRFRARAEPKQGLPETLGFSSCRASPTVTCTRDAFAVEECSEVSAGIRCTSEQAVPEGERSLSASCAGRSLRVQRLAGGEIEVSGLDRCWQAGALDITVGWLSDAQIVADVGVLALLEASTVMQDVFGGGTISGEDFNDVLDDPFEHEGQGLVGVVGVIGTEDWGTGGGGGGGALRIGGLDRSDRPPPPEPWPVWPGARTHGEPIELSADQLAIAGHEILAIADESAILLSLEDGVERGRFRLMHHAPGREVDQLCVSPDASRFAVVWGSVGLDTDGGGYEMWTLGPDPALVISEETRWSSHSCAFTADGRWLAVGTREGLRIWDVQRGLLRRSAGHEGDMLDQVRLLTASPKGQLLLLQWDYERLGTLDVSSGHRQDLGAFEGFPLASAWLPTGTFAFASDGTLLWHPKLGEQARGPGDGLLLVPLGENLLVSTERGPVVLDAAAGVLGGLGGPARRPEAMAVSADGEWIVVSTWEGLLRYRVQP